MFTHKTLSRRGPRFREEGSCPVKPEDPGLRSKAKGFVRVLKKQTNLRFALRRDDGDMGGNGDIRHIGIIIFVCFAMVLAFGAQAEEKSMAHQKPKQTLREVLRLAYINNPTLQAARAEVRATHELLPQALSGWRPTIAAQGSVFSSDIEGSNFGGTGSTAKDMEVSLNQPLFRGWQTLAETEAARNTISAQSAALRAKEQDVLLDAATAYMDVVRDQALLELSRNNLEVITRQREATKDRFDVGELTRTDVSQADARLARANADVITDRGKLRSSKAVFEQVSGIVPGILAPPDIEIAFPKTLDDVMIKAENESPEVLSALYVHKASEEDIEDVFGELLPEIGLFGSWNRTLDPQPGLIDKQTTKTLGLLASIPLYQAGAVRSRVRQAKHTANQRYLEILSAKRQARQETISNWEDVQTARAEIRSREAQVEASRIAQEGVRAETEVGERTILDSLDADQEFLDAQVALVTARRNEVVANFALGATLGLLTPETLGFAGNGVDLHENLQNVAWKFFDMDVDRVGSAH